MAKEQGAHEEEQEMEDEQSLDEKASGSIAEEACGGES